MIVAPITAAALTSVPERYSGLAAGVNATFSRLGSLLAIAILGAVASLVFAARTDDPELVPFALDQQGQEFIAGSTDAFHAAMVVAATLALAGTLAALGYSRLPEAGTVAEDAEQRFRLRCSSILLHPIVQSPSPTMSRETSLLRGRGGPDRRSLEATRAGGLSCRAPAHRRGRPPPRRPLQPARG